MSLDMFIFLLLFCTGTEIVFSQEIQEPFNLTAINITGTSITLIWTPDGNQSMGINEEYKLTYHNSSCEDTELVAKSEKFKVLINSLKQLIVPKNANHDFLSVLPLIPITALVIQNSVTMNNLMGYQARVSMVRKQVRLFCVLHCVQCTVMCTVQVRGAMEIALFIQNIQEERAEVALYIFTNQSTAATDTQREINRKGTSVVDNNPEKTKIFIQICQVVFH